MDIKRFIKTTFTVCAFVAPTASIAGGLLGLDAFLPANEAYTYDSTLGVITGFCGGVGGTTSSAIHVSGKVWDSSTGSLSKDKVYEFAEWASSCTSYIAGSGISGSGTDSSAEQWKDTSKALGKASASDTSAVVVLGDGGSITLSFERAICNGAGYDFAVFENALNDSFLEFGFVSVSTDGTHFLKFPNFYLGASPVGSDGNEGGGVNDPTYVYNLGDKYRIGYGNGYDLSELESVYNYILAHYDLESGVISDSCIFSADYISGFLENYEYIDLDKINYVKIDDIVGDGGTLDSSGNKIYDAYPTSGTAGFDLDAIGVINCAPIPEPSLIALIFGIGSLGVALLIRKPRK